MAAQSQHNSRFAELLDALKVEYDRLSSENAGYKGIRGEWSRKVEEQTTELNAMLSEIHDLERKHQLVKEQYEAEIMRLKGQSPPTAPSQQPPPSIPTSQLPNTSANPSKRRAPGAPGLPETTSQIPSYTPNIPPDQALPGMFASRPMPGHQLPSQQPQPANPARLLGISSLPSAPTVGASPASIPAMNPAGPSAMRNVAAPPALNKMHPMGLLPPNGTASRDPNPLHTIKKDPSLSIAQSMPGGALGPAATSNGPFASNRPGMPSQPAQSAPAPNEDDWKVYQGRAANGSLVNMKVSLQNSLSLDSVVCCVRYSWDGQYLATGSNRSAHIFDASTGQSVATFSKDTGTEREDGSSTDSYVRAVCFSPDGNWLITGAEDHVVKVWDVRNRKVKHRLVGHDTDIYSVDASANSQFIISGSGDKKAKLWSLESGKLLSTLGEEYGPTDGITSVSVSPTSQHVAAGSLDKVVRVWDVESSRLVRQFEGHRDSVYSVAFSPDGRMLLSGSLDKTLKLWDLAASQPSSQCRLSFTGHKDFVLSVAFSPNGRWLISGSKDRTVQFWDPRQSTMCLLLQGHKNSVISIAHNPASKSLATGSGDCRARTWLYS